MLRDPKYILWVALLWSTKVAHCSERINSNRSVSLNELWAFFYWQNVAWVLMILQKPLSYYLHCNVSTCCECLRFLADNIVLVVIAQTLFCLFWREHFSHEWCGKYVQQCSKMSCNVVITRRKSMRCMFHTVLEKHFLYFKTLTSAKYLQMK